MPNPMIAMPGGVEWLIILAIVVLIFGAAKLPDLARGTGQALRIFKAETKGLRDDDTEASDGEPPVPPVQAPPGELPSATQDPAPVEDRQADKNNG
jgi:sec-independent protein translocase protein TatA